ncbi:hypothetical protein HY571_00405 [Candidatus Micrarchaeota archaeon]|nr:hypothetical protein [Candidatus Micrarchaeota archaeon]
MEDYGEYDDHEGENISAEVDDQYITDKQYRCEKCRKTRREKHGVLFAPFCCGRPMKLVHRLEHKFDFESIAQRSIQREEALFPGTVKVKTKSKKTTKTKTRRKISKKPKKTKSRKKRQR